MKYRRWLRLPAQTRDDVTREVEEELEAHVALRAEELLRDGESAARARAEALRRFGDYEHARAELIRTAQVRRGRRRRTAWLSGVRQDFTYALRRCVKQPAVTVGAVLLLGLGIGLATAVFTLVNGVLLRSLPFPAADRLYAVATLDSARNVVPTLAIANWVDWRARSRTIEAGALWQTFRTPVAVEREAVRATVTYATGDFFRALQPPLVQGRAFTHGEAQDGSAGVVVSEAFWRGRLGGRSLPLAMTIGSSTRDVVGVIRSGYSFPRDTDVWFAIEERPAGGMERNYINYTGVVRLSPAATLEEAARELESISSEIRRADPAALYLWGVELEPLNGVIAGDAAAYLPVLMAAVLLVLLIACANLAGLNIARATGRRAEMAVRTSLGAGRGRLIRQLLVEHLVIALAGGALGVLLAFALVDVTLAAVPALLPRPDEVRIDPRVLGFAAVLTIAAGLSTGLLPALRLSRVSLRAQLSGPRGGITGGRGLPGAVLVGLELTAAIVLLVASMLLTRSYRAVLGRELGYDTENIIAAEVVLPRHRYRDPETTLDYWDRLLRELRLTPGITAASAATWIPLGGGATTFVEAEGNAAPNLGGGYRVVGDDYFRTLGIGLVAGRGIAAADGAGAERVVVVNEAMAQLRWPGVIPLGRRLRTPVMEGGPDGSPPAPWLTVIGVVRNVRHWGIEEDPAPELYVSFRQVPRLAGSMAAVARVRGAPGALVPLVQSVVRSVDPHTPADIQVLHDRLNASLQPRRLLLAVLGGFGAAALLLAAIGLYSLLAFAVAQRAREIAIRLVLGADQSALVRSVFVNALTIVVCGIAAGLLAAVVLTRFIRALLVDVTPLDPVSLAVVPLILLGAGAAAALLPACRAARLSPVKALGPE